MGKLNVFEDKNKKTTESVFIEKLKGEGFEGSYIAMYTSVLSLFFLLASLIGAIYTKETDFWYNLYKIITSPSKLVTDYFALGGLGSCFFNAAICGFSANLIIFFARAKAVVTSFAGYMLVVAHCFYGLNILNMWPTIIGVFVYCFVTKKSISENIHLALFSTALGPFISEFLFRYPNREFVIGEPGVTVLGVVLAILFGILAGFVVPALIPGTSSMHRGYNLYKAGLAIGILGIFIYNLMYATVGFAPPENLIIDNPQYYAMPYAYRGFVNIFFIILFSATISWGFIWNNFSFKGYRQLLKSTGYGVSFLRKFTMPVCMINIGVLGLCIIAYLNLIFVLPEIFPALPSGVGFTGATVGVVFAALTFSVNGQQPRTVFPIVIGYTLLFVLVAVASVAIGQEIPWTLSTQTYINGLAFATGLCTFSGRYGWHIGMIAGFFNAVICTATAEMYGGLVLYNGGFSAGLTALVLLPILDFYNIQPKFEEDK